jgi:hypothetical protein
LALLMMNPARGRANPRAPAGARYGLVGFTPGGAALARGYWLAAPPGRPVREGTGDRADQSPDGYAIVPAAQSKLTQPVIVQYVAPPNRLWYAPYCTIEGAAHGKRAESTTFSCVAECTTDT